MLNNILDSAKAYSFSDCPNPQLLDRYVAKDTFSEHQLELIMHYTNDCRDCKECLEEEIEIAHERFRQNLRKDKD